ncbi:MAG: hypothetical protein GC172_03775 [Phycisphaera sp.]|nr:hypothetical protein [Phycisphaera sp.]
MLDRSSARRKFAYPLVTLAVAGVVYLLSRGQIASTAPAAPAEYEAVAREVVAAVRAGQPVPRAVTPTIDTVFASMAPPCVREDGGGALAYRVAGPLMTDGTMPWIQSVEIRCGSGEGVALSIAILDGRPEVVGVARLDAVAPEGVAP